MRYYDFRKQVFLSPFEVDSWHLSPSQLLSILVLPVKEPPEHTNLLTQPTLHHVNRVGNYAVLTWDERDKNYEELNGALPELQRLKREEFRMALAKLDTYKMRPLSALTIKNMSLVSITKDDKDLRALQNFEANSNRDRGKLRTIENAALPTEPDSGQTLDETSLKYLASLLALKPGEGQGTNPDKPGVEPEFLAGVLTDVRP